MARNVTEDARRLRAESTDAERMFWGRVRDRRLAGYKFRRQYPIHNYIVDFVCAEARLIVELDGGQHAGSRADRLRDAKLAADGYRVLRFWNSDVLTNLDGVVEVTLEKLGLPSPQPSPGTGRGGS